MNAQAATYRHANTVSNLTARAPRALAQPIRPGELYEMIAEVTGGDEPPQGAAAGEVPCAVDWDQAFNAVQGDKALLRELIAIFLEDYPELLSLARRSLAKGDTVGLQRAARVLKGSLRHFGAGPVYELCHEVESIAGAGATDRAATACFYVAHRQVAGLFGDDERRLAEFIAAIAGAALENAAGFEEMREWNATLEQKVAERTADLNARKDELPRSNSELEQFAYVASHDLQEPLRTVRSYCKLLAQHAEQILDEKSRQHIEQAVEASGRMRTLIKDLLAYSRVGRQGDPFQPTDCNAVVERAVANLSLRIEETGARIICDELPRVHGDPTQLLQLFQNLIGNAIKFRGDRQPRVQIGAQRREGQWEVRLLDDSGGEILLLQVTKA